MAESKRKEKHLEQDAIEPAKGQKEELTEQDLHKVSGGVKGEIK